MKEYKHTGVDIKEEYIATAKEQIRVITMIIEGVEKGKALSALCKDNNISMKSFRRLWFNNCLFERYDSNEVNKLMYYCLSWQERLFIYLLEGKRLKDLSLSDDNDILNKIPLNVNDNIDYVITKLRTNYGKVIKLYWRDGLTFEEVGAYLGFNKERAHALNMKACEILRQPDMMNMIRLGKVNMDNILSCRENNLK